MSAPTEADSGFINRHKRPLSSQHPSKCHLLIMGCAQKTLMLGNIEGKRRRRWQRIKWLDSITNSLDTSSNKIQETVKDRRAWRAAVHGVD